MQELSLSLNKIGDEGLAVLADALPLCSNLNLLNLKGNQIGAEGAKALAEVLPHCPSLQELNLCSNKIRVEGAKALAAALPLCPNLQELSLSHNQIGDEGAKALAEVLPHCPNLQELSLSLNKIGDEGARALAAALPNYRNLKTLDLSYNLIGDEAIKALVGALDNNLSVQGCSLSQVLVEGIKEILGMKEILDRNKKPATKTVAELIRAVTASDEEQKKGHIKAAAKMFVDNRAVIEIEEFTGLLQRYFIAAYSDEVEARSSVYEQFVRLAYPELAKINISTAEVQANFPLSVFAEVEVNLISLSNVKILVREKVVGVTLKEEDYKKIIEHLTDEQKGLIKVHPYVVLPQSANPGIASGLIPGEILRLLMASVFDETGQGEKVPDLSTEDGLPVTGEVGACGGAAA